MTIMWLLHLRKLALDFYISIEPAWIKLSVLDFE